MCDREVHVLIEQSFEVETIRRALCKHAMNDLAKLRELAATELGASDVVSEVLFELA